MNPSRADSLTDLTSGLVIAVSVALTVIAGNTGGLAVGFGVLTSSVPCVVWKRARFDPNRMTTAVTETVGETVGEAVEGTVENTPEPVALFDPLMTARVVLVQNAGPEFGF